MKVYVYASELTEQMIITQTNHGLEWTMRDGEVFDLLSRTDLDVNVITLDGRPSSADICTEKDLEDTIMA